MNRAYSILAVKSVDEERRILRGVATTPAPDRVSDVVEPLGVKFTNPMPLLHQHDSSRPVGTVTFDKPTKAGINFTAILPKISVPGPLKDRVDTAWGEVASGLVRGVSIGFRPLEFSHIEDTGGIRYLSSEVMELSLVTIPAQPEAVITSFKNMDAAAIAVIKKFDVNAPAASGHTDSDVKTTPPAPGKKKSIPIQAQEAKHVMKKSIAEQISAFEGTLVAKSTSMDEIMDAAAEAGTTLDADQKEAYDTLEGEVKEINEHIVRLKTREKSLVAQARQVEGATLKTAGESRDITARHTPVVTMRNAAPKGAGFVRLLAARYMAKEDGCLPADIALSRGWGEDIASVLRMPKEIIQKAAVGAASTTDSAWAGPLVVYQNLQDEFIELLRPNSVIARIPGLRHVPFNVKVPRETATTTAYWVGQGSPKPVSKGAMDSITLDFAKVAGITFQTQELMRFSRPASETIMINSLTKAITLLVDSDFLDPSKAVATGVSPASITNGSSSITATGLTSDAFRADFASALALYTRANYSLSGLVLLMTQTQAMRLSLMRTDFQQKLFPDLTKDGGVVEGIPVVTSENIVAQGGSPADGALIAFVNAPDILLADDGAVQVDVSSEASIQTDSAPDSPTTASTTLVSLWQNNMVGIRCERFITWQKARTDSVVYISGANYSVVS